MMTLLLQVNILLPIIFLLVMLFLVLLPLFHNASECLVSLAIISTGLPVYLLLVRCKSKPRFLRMSVGKCCKSLSLSKFSWHSACDRSVYSSSSSSSSVPISEHSHKLTPLWTILRKHPRCVKTKVMGLKVELYFTQPCPPEWVLAMVTATARE